MTMVRSIFITSLEVVALASRKQHICTPFKMQPLLSMSLYEPRQPKNPQHPYRVDSLHCLSSVYFRVSVTKLKGVFSWTGWWTTRCLSFCLTRRICAQASWLMSSAACLAAAMDAFWVWDVLMWVSHLSLREATGQDESGALLPIYAPSSSYLHFLFLSLYQSELSILLLLKLHHSCCFTRLHDIFKFSAERKQKLGHCLQTKWALMCGY